MTVEQCKMLHGLLVEGKWISAANTIMLHLGKFPDVKNETEAKKICRMLCQWLLDKDLYLEAATLQWGPDIFNTEPESVRRVFKAMQEGSKILLMGASSMSKCLRINELVLMHDGTKKLVQEVVVGDLLMGDDGSPRKVLKANGGVGQLYTIIPERGKEWTCNDAHILSLRVSSDKKCGSGCVSKKWRKGDVVDIPIQEYMALSKDKKNRLKQFHVGVDMPNQTVPFDPYVIGAWIGDGTTTAPTLNTPYGPMAKEWTRYFESIGYLVTRGGQEGKVCERFNAVTLTGAPNPFRLYILSTVVDGEKRIPDIYLRNSKINRLRLLAGLIDSDGWVHQKTGYQFVTKFKQLADQVSWLARSLGFSGHQYTRKHGIKSIGFSADYYHVSITGSGVTEIPTFEKKCKEPSGKKNLNNTSFTIKDAGVGQYFGFVIDGNHRFLLDDFTVTHNTYSAGAFMVLDWWRDPRYTTIKLAAVNEDHLKKNLFAHVVSLYKACAIQLEDKVDFRESDLWMGIKEAGAEFGISGIAFKQSQETSGQFKGYKAKPVRQKPHPQFGKMSRLRVLGDEGQNWPGGPFQDFNSITASVVGKEMIKLVIAFNPESLSQLVVQKAEPEEGWAHSQVDTMHDWESKQGWRVCRLDAAICENVVQKKIVYPGLQTYDGYMGYLKSGGDSSPAFFTFGRGFPPMLGSINTIIQPLWPQDARGEAIFIETPTVFGAVDLAFMGIDSAQMAVGRWGLASGYRDANHNFIYFKDRLNVANNKPRHVLQIDSIMPMEKHSDTIKMAEEIIARCKNLGIKPENVAIDATGYGFGVGSHLVKVWGDTYNIAWAGKAGTGKILAEDTEGADKQVIGIMSEMWWTMRRWLDPVCRAVLINPIIPQQPINTQLTSRRYRHGKEGKIQVESKEEYKARNQHSPDEVDAIIMLTLLVRKNSPILPGLVEQANATKEQNGMKFDYAKNNVNIDFADSIGADGVED